MNEKAKNALLNMPEYSGDAEGFLNESATVIQMALGCPQRNG